MAKFVVDCGVVLHLVGEEIELPAVARGAEGIVPTAPIEALRRT